MAACGHESQLQLKLQMGFMYTRASADKRARPKVITVYYNHECD